MHVTVLCACKMLLYVTVVYAYNMLLFITVLCAPIMLIFVTGLYACNTVLCWLHVLVTYYSVLQFFMHVMCYSTFSVHRTCYRITVSVPVTCYGVLQYLCL